MAGPAGTPGVPGAAAAPAGSSGDPAYLAFQRAALGHGTLPAGGTTNVVGTAPATPFKPNTAPPAPPVSSIPPLIQPGQGGGSLGGDPAYLAMQRAVLGEQQTAISNESTTDTSLQQQQAAADKALAQQQKVADARAGLTYGGRGIQNSSEAISGLVNLNAGYASRQQTYDAGIANQMAALDAALNQTLAGLNTKMAEQTLTSAATQSQQAGVNGPNPYLPAAAPAGFTPAASPVQLQGWVTQAAQIAGIDPSWIPALSTIAMHEDSSLNPSQKNLWDSNAKAGHPSEGIMQTIPSTFAAYALPGHTNIDNPIDNIIAAIRYIQAKYGSVWNVPGIVALSHGQPYVGY